MVAVQVIQIIELNAPGMHAVQVQADNTETFQAPFPVYGAIFQPNRASGASDSWGLTFTAGQTLITFSLTGTTTNVTGTLLVFGI